MLQQFHEWVIEAKAECFRLQSVLEESQNLANLSTDALTSDNNALKQGVHLESFS